MTTTTSPSKSPAQRASAPSLDSLKVKIFADGADMPVMIDMNKRPFIKGFTTNPTLMRKAGVTDYRAYARSVLTNLPGKPISFEVLSDDFDRMEREAREIASWGEYVYVKIPVTNTKLEPSTDLIRKLSSAGIKINVTALTTPDQVAIVSEALGDKTPCNISVFAGRVADTGRDPLPIMIQSLKIMKPHPNQELIWASPRELLNIFQADQIGCHIITITQDVFKKLPLVCKDLSQYSLETVEMFHRDAKEAGISLNV